MYTSVKSQCIGVFDEKQQNYTDWDILVKDYYYLHSHIAFRPFFLLLIFFSLLPYKLVFELFSSVFSSHYSFTSFLVSKANLTVVATILGVGFYLFCFLFFVFLDQLLSTKDRLPYFLNLLASLEKLCRCLYHNWY